MDEKPEDVPSSSSSSIPFHPRDSSSDTTSEVDRPATSSSAPPVPPISASGALPPPRWPEAAKPSSTSSHGVEPGRGDKLIEVASAIEPLVVDSPFLAGYSLGGETGVQPTATTTASPAAALTLNGILSSTPEVSCPSGSSSRRPTNSETTPENSASTSTPAEEQQDLVRLKVCPTTSGQFEISISRSSTVEDFKRQIAKRLKLPKERIRLLARERELSTGVLSDYPALYDGAKVTLVPNVETGLALHHPSPTESIMQALETLSDDQINSFLMGQVPLTLALRIGNHMMLVQLELSSVTKRSSRSKHKSSRTQKNNCSAQPCAAAAAAAAASAAAAAAAASAAASSTAPPTASVPDPNDATRSSMALTPYLDGTSAADIHSSSSSFRFSPMWPLLPGLTSASPFLHPFADSSLGVNQDPASAGASTSGAKTSTASQQEGAKVGNASTSSASLSSPFLDAALHRASRRTLDRSTMPTSAENEVDAATAASKSTETVAEIAAGPSSLVSGDSSASPSSSAPSNHQGAASVDNALPSLSDFSSIPIQTQRNPFFFAPPPQSTLTNSSSSSSSHPQLQYFPIHPISSLQHIYHPAFTIPPPASDVAAAAAPSSSSSSSQPNSPTPDSVEALHCSSSSSSTESPLSSAPSVKPSSSGESNLSPTESATVKSNPETLYHPQPVVPSTGQTHHSQPHHHYPPHPFLFPHYFTIPYSHYAWSTSTVKNLPNSSATSSSTTSSATSSSTSSATTSSTSSSTGSTSRRSSGVIPPVFLPSQFFHQSCFADPSSSSSSSQHHSQHHHHHHHHHHHAFKRTSSGAFKGRRHHHGDQGNGETTPGDAAASSSSRSVRDVVERIQQRRHAPLVEVVTEFASPEAARSARDKRRRTMETPARDAPADSSAASLETPKVTASDYTQCYSKSSQQDPAQAQSTVAAGLPATPSNAQFSSQSIPPRTEHAVSQAAFVSGANSATTTTSSNQLPSQQAHHHGHHHHHKERSRHHRHRHREDGKSRDGAIIESMHSHGRGIFSGTFSGRLRPDLQDKDGRPKRSINTIVHILNDLLKASPQFSSIASATVGHCPYGRVHSITSSTSAVSLSQHLHASSSSSSSHRRHHRHHRHSREARELARREREAARQAAAAAATPATPQQLALMQQTSQENFRTKSKMALLQLALEERKRKREQRKAKARATASAPKETGSGSSALPFRRFDAIDATAVNIGTMEIEDAGANPPPAVSPTAIHTAAMTD